MNTKAEEKFNNETIITCTCKGKGGRLTNGWDCNGKGKCTEWIDQDPCGASIYDYHECPVYSKKVVTVTTIRKKPSKPKDKVPF